MIVKVIAYKDLKLNIYTSPIYLDGDSSIEEIVEKTRRMCANPKLPVEYFDYDLYLLGTFDDKTGLFKTEAPEFLCSLADYKHLRAVQEEVKQDVVNS